jgi:uncharacterized membrane protein
VVFLLAWTLVNSALPARRAIDPYPFMNLKAEIEIMALHEKMDALRSEQLVAMFAKQQEQIDLLSQLLARAAPADGGHSSR